MVSSRRRNTLKRMLRKPSRITWPAMVPTVEEESPEASKEMAKITAEAGPSSGASVRCACSMLWTATPLR